MGEDGNIQELPSPQVELDISIDSYNENDSDYKQDFVKNEEEDSIISLF